MFDKKTIRDIDVAGKKVLVRVDFNVPIKDGVITDDTRIKAALPTIEYLLEKGAAVILMSHLGRPKAKVDLAFTLKPVAERLANLLGKEVIFASDCLGEETKAAANALRSGDVMLLENTRFYAGEEANDPAMAEELASLADIYVNDAFGTAHRAHASTEGVTKFLPGVAGFLMEKEIKYLSQVVEKPERPFIAILGGAKISDKIGVIKNLLTKADKILIGGGMANTFLKAQGYEMGDSLVEADVIETAKSLLAESSGKLLLPVDLVLADKFAEDADAKTVPVGDVEAGWRVLDIGPETVKLYNDEIAMAATVIWNGPMGVFEFAPFAKGTFGIAEGIAASNAVSVIGGGDSVAAVQKSGLADKVTHISTGGGASLEMLEGLELPGVAALQNN